MIDGVMHCTMTNVEWLVQLNRCEFATPLDIIVKGPSFVAEVAVKYIHEYLLNSSVLHYQDRFFVLLCQGRNPGGAQPILNMAGVEAIGQLHERFFAALRISRHLSVSVIVIHYSVQEQCQHS
jgi:hypothetical protein